MPVQTPSSDYTEQAPAWAKIRKLMSGEVAARDLVQKLPGMEEADYKLFKDRASYLPVMERTVDMFDGLLFFRDPQVKVPTSLQPYVDDLTMDGVPAIRFASKIANEVLQTSRVGALIDYPRVEGSAEMTVAEAEAAGLRAHARLYPTETILFVEYGRSRGVRRLTQCRLSEVRATRDPKDEFAVVQTNIIRVLELDAAGLYQQRIFVQDSKTKEYVQEGGPIIPMRQGKRLGYIPFAFFSHKDREGVAKRPALAALSDVSASHINSMALLEWGLMWTANPTPVFVGVAPPQVDEKGCALEGSSNAIHLGSSKGITLPIGGSAEFMEFSGKGLEAVAKSIEHKEKHMARIGARALMDDPREAVAAETARIQRASDHSLLGSIAANVSEGMTWILWELAAWAGVQLKSGDGMQLNRNFIPTTIAPEMLKQLMAAVQAGRITEADFFAKLQAGEIIRDGVTFDEHRAEIEEDGNRAAAEEQDFEPAPVVP